MAAYAQSDYRAALERYLEEIEDVALERLMPLVYSELHRLASAYLRRERPNHTLQSTALVHEAFLRMVSQHDVPWRNRAHFYGTPPR